MYLFKTDKDRQRTWDDAKLRRERAEKNKKVDKDSILASITQNIPALIGCEKIQNRAAIYGFD